MFFPFIAARPSRQMPERACQLPTRLELPGARAQPVLLARTAPASWAYPPAAPSVRFTSSVVPYPDASASGVGGVAPSPTALSKFGAQYGVRLLPLNWLPTPIASLTETRAWSTAAGHESAAVEFE